MQLTKYKRQWCLFILFNYWFHQLMHSPSSQCIPYMLSSSLKFLSHIMRRVKQQVKTVKININISSAFFAHADITLLMFVFLPNSRRQRRCGRAKYISWHKTLIKHELLASPVASHVSLTHCSDAPNDYVKLSMTWREVLRCDCGMTCICTYTHTHTHTYTHTHTHTTHMSAPPQCVYIVCIFMYGYLCVFVCMCSKRSEYFKRNILFNI